MSFTTPTNVYYLIDPSAAQAGPTGGMPGGGSGDQLCADYTAPSLTAATTIAHLYSSIFQRPVQLLNKYNPSFPLTVVNGVGATSTLTTVPSGIGY